MTSKKKIIFADLSLFIIAIIWGMGFIVVKSSLDYISPLWMIAARFSIAATISSLYFYKKFRAMNKKVLLSGILSGFLLYTAFATQTIGIQYTTVSKNAFVTVTYVAMVPFIYWLVIKKRPKAAQIIAAILSLTGVALLTMPTGFSNINIGDLLTFCCAMLFAIHIVYLSIYTKECDPISLNVVQILTATVLAIITALIFEPIPTTINTEVIVSMLYLGSLSTFLAYLVQTVAQKYTAPSHVSLILSLECAIGCIGSVIFLNEILTPVMWFGAVLSFASIIISELAINKKSSKSKDKNSLNAKTAQNHQQIPELTNSIAE